MERLQLSFDVTDEFTGDRASIAARAKLGIRQSNIDPAMEMHVAAARARHHPAPLVALPQGRSGGAIQNKASFRERHRYRITSPGAGHYTAETRKCFVHEM
jgi:hypothetical protein